jgi:hypothetical protein
MSLRAGEGLESGTITGGTDGIGSSNHSVTDHHADDLRTPGKNDSKSSKSGSSNSSNSSGSGGDNHYSADCSGDGGSDDNQSSDDTSGKPKQHAMMLDSSAILAHHHHHHHHHHQQQQQHQNHKHKGGGKNNQYVNDNTSSDSNSSNEDDDENDHQQRDKDKPTGRSAYNKTFGGHNHRGNPNGVEHTQQQLSLLSTKADPTTTMADSKNHSRDDGKSAMTTAMMMIDPQINLSLVHHVPSSSLVLPLHATATAALLQSVVPLLQQQQQNPTLDSRSTVLDNTPLPTPTDTTGSTADTNHHGPMIMSHGPQHPSMSSPAVAPPSDHMVGIPPPAASLLTVEHYRHLMEVRGQYILYTIHVTGCW